MAHPGYYLPSWQGRNLCAAQGGCCGRGGQLLSKDISPAFHETGHHSSWLFPGRVTARDQGQVGSVGNLLLEVFNQNYVAANSAARYSQLTAIRRPIEPEDLIRFEIG